MHMYGIVTQAQASAGVVHMPEITENATLCVFTSTSTCSTTVGESLCSETSASQFGQNRENRFEGQALRQ